MQVTSVVITPAIARPPGGRLLLRFALLLHVAAEQPHGEHLRGVEHLLVLGDGGELKRGLHVRCLQQLEEEHELLRVRRADALVFDERLQVHELPAVQHPAALDEEPVHELELNVDGDELVGDSLDVRVECVALLLRRPSRLLLPPSAPPASPPASPAAASSACRLSGLLDQRVHLRLQPRQLRGLLLLLSEKSVAVALHLQHCREHNVATVDVYCIVYIQYNKLRIHQ